RASRVVHDSVGVDVATGAIVRDVVVVEVPRQVRAELVFDGVRHRVEVRVNGDRVRPGACRRDVLSAEQSAVHAHIAGEVGPEVNRRRDEVDVRVVLGGARPVRHVPEVVLAVRPATPVAEGPVDAKVRRRGTPPIGARVTRRNATLGATTTSGATVCWPNTTVGRPGITEPSAGSRSPTLSAAYTRIRVFEVSKTVARSSSCWPLTAASAE